MSTIISQKRQNHTYMRLREDFIENIKSNKWPINSKLPSENILAKEYAVSRDTIRKALKTLEVEGLLVTEQGRGRTVARSDQKRKSSDFSLKTRTIGMIVSKIENDVYGDIQSTQSTLNEHDFNLLLYTLVGKTTANSYVYHPFDNIHRDQIDGLLIYCQNILPEDIVEFNKSVPTVAIYHSCAKFGVPSFYIHWTFAAYQASIHLFEQGYSEQLILLYNRPYFADINEELIRGIMFAHHQRGVKFDKERIVYISEGLRTYEEVVVYEEESLQPILAKMDKYNINGILTYLNDPAVNIANYALKNGIKIPEELAIVALSDNKHLNKSPIPITAVNFDRESIGRIAATMLTDLLEGKITDGNYKLDNPFFGTLIPRQSTVIPN